jgi:ParB family chromosome partitioning protein
MRRALGKGLSQLIAEQFEGPPSEADIDSITPNPHQPRHVFDPAALEELAQSIREHGILQPLTVRPLTEGRYQLIAGERRLRAAKLAGLSSVPISIRSADDRNALELALIENVQREDIGPMECARAYRRLQEDFQLTQEQISERVGKSRASVTNTIRLLKLPKRIQEGLERNTISEGHARALLALEQEPVMLAAYEKTIAKGLTVRDVEAMHKEAPALAVKPKEAKPKDPNESAIEEGLSKLMGAPVKIERRGRHGTVVIEFYSDDDLERLLELLGLQL